ncbi:Protein phosphatase 2C 7 [Coniosporium apollinis]|uniref:Protein phosphatase n=2 Tax=Coniosporium TaxID=2810619 RepID=A0ABQ9P5J9_9PEZI|nr:Protein phosphatase 2C 7 [Cladosporium sp. JES 115]KAJ9669363.1 Protein phosphatase 2C 7 [Coniosporium apollinis]
MAPPHYRTVQTSARPQSQPRYTYHISAAYSAKGQRLNPDQNLYNYNPYMRVTKTATELANGKRDKRNRPQSGQDAFLVSNVGDTGAVAFGVADGVGGWTDSGIDPADFSHSLCDYMASAAGAFPEGFPEGPLRPRDLLQHGFQRVVQDKSIEGGGSTACIATAEPDGRFEVANLGDSGFLQLGVNAVRNMSEPQTHAFNTPYQLSKLPQKMLAQMALFGGGAKPLQDLPKDAQIYNHQVKHGDVLVFATDGVWDNITPQEILGIVSRLMTTFGGWKGTGNGLEVSKKLSALTQKGSISKSGENTLQALLALAITQEAKAASLNQRRDGPFAKAVQKEYPNENWHGGKPDDICTVVAIAVKDEAPRAKL